MPHVHVAIRGVESLRENMPNCTGALLEVAFQDLDPNTIRKSPLYATKPEKGDELIETCMKEAHAVQIAAFVAATPDDKLIVVNCAGGVSRSPGVVLALRRFYGGDTEEVFNKAHPNMHVTSLLTKVLRRESGSVPLPDQENGIPALGAVPRGESMTEAELVDMEVVFRKEVPSNPMGAMGLKLIADLRLWNGRAHQALKDGLALAGGISDAAMMLEGAGIKIMAERDVYKKALEELRTLLGEASSHTRSVKGFEIADLALRAGPLSIGPKEPQEPKESK